MISSKRGGYFLIQNKHHAYEKMFSSYSSRKFVRKSKLKTLEMILALAHFLFYFSYSKIRMLFKKRGSERIQATIDICMLRAIVPQHLTL